MINEFQAIFQVGINIRPEKQGGGGWVVGWGMGNGEGGKVDKDTLG